MEELGHSSLVISSKGNCTFSSSICSEYRTQTIPYPCVYSFSRYLVSIYSVLNASNKMVIHGSFHGITLAYLASDAYNHRCGTMQSQLQKVEVTERHRTSKIFHGLVLWSNVTSLPDRKTQRPDQQMQLEEEKPISICLYRRLPHSSGNRRPGDMNMFYPFFCILFFFFLVYF